MYDWVSLGYLENSMAVLLGRVLVEPVEVTYIVQGQSGKII
jgi:hypothetical protein